jgi:hypothetical protein
MQMCRSETQAIPYPVRRQALAASDYTVENKGTLLLLRSSNANAYEWLVNHTEPEAHWFGRAAPLRRLHRERRAGVRGQAGAASRNRVMSGLFP